MIFALFFGFLVTVVICDTLQTIFTENARVKNLHRDQEIVRLRERVRELEEKLLTYTEE